MVNTRRRFMQCMLAAALAPSVTACTRADAGKGLVGDPNKIVDLPKGFSYRVVSRVGERMSDGLVVPGKHDGMAAFAADDGRIALVCNHELGPDARDSAFPGGVDDLTAEQLASFYDAGGEATPGAGGTTTTIYNPATGETERQHLSLAGTEINCAGGSTPWGSWLSCEECFETPGRGLSGGRVMTRERHHGYVFEVPADARGLVEPRPIKAMGRFEHEAAVVHRRTGIVYETEDRHHSLFYRYLPNSPGDLHAGGRLQALVIRDKPSLVTHNWTRQPSIRAGESLEVEWLDLENVDSNENDLRLRGEARGAATFARGEGLCEAGDALAFSCTIGGAARLGQVFVYQPSPFEGTEREREAPGILSLLVEADGSSMLRNADNLTMAPWGDLMVCEDTDGPCSLIGVKPDGRLYRFLQSAYSDSELAGVCFSPDGQTLFVNIQYPGMTIAVNGPWESLA